MNILLFISYVVWAIISFYCLKRYNQKYGSDLLRFAYVTFIISALNSTMGLTEIYRDDVMVSMRSLIELLQAAVAFPCLTTEVWLKYNVAQKEVAWLHAVIGLIPTYIFLFQHYTRQDLVDFAVIMNMVSLTGVGFLYTNFYAISASGMIFLAYCIFYYRTELSYEPSSKLIFNYCMALFTYCVTAYTFLLLDLKLLL